MGGNGFVMLSGQRDMEKNTWKFALRKIRERERERIIEVGSVEGRGNNRRYTGNIDGKKCVVVKGVGHYNWNSIMNDFVIESHSDSIKIYLKNF